MKQCEHNYIECRDESYSCGWCSNKNMCFFCFKCLKIEQKRIKVKLCNKKHF